MEYCIDNYLIREIKENDFTDIHNFASDEEVCRYQTWGPNQFKDTRSFIQSAIDERLNIPRNNFIFAIYSSNDKMVIGTCAIFIKGNFIAEIGYTLSKSVWRKGIGTIIVKSLIEICFKELNIETVIATTDALNIGSNSLLLKTGFKKSKTVVAHMNIKGRIRDTIIYEFKKNMH